MIEMEDRKTDAELSTAIVDGRPEPEEFHGPGPIVPIEIARICLKWRGVYQSACMVYGYLRQDGRAVMPNWWAVAKGSGVKFEDIPRIVARMEEKELIAISDTGRVYLLRG